MDWTLAITRNSDALKPIIAALCAMAGLKSGKVPAARNDEPFRPLMLPRHVIGAILLILRPAESAVRRLIVILATLTEAARQTSALPLIRSFGPPSPREWRGEGDTGEDLLDDQNVSKAPNDGENTSKSMRLSPSPRVFTGRRWPNGPDEGQRRFNAVVITPSDGSRTPNTPAFALFDPLKTFDPDTIWNLDEASDSGFRSGEDIMNDPTFGWRILPDAEEPIPAQAILRRLAAIARALDTLAYQARRLLRFNARRAALLKKPFKHPIRLSPMRPGLPPGWRQRSIHEIDPILKECHLLANDLLCDTS